MPVAFGFPAAPDAPAVPGSPVAPGAGVVVPAPAGVRSGLFEDPSRAGDEGERPGEAVLPCPDFGADEAGVREDPDAPDGLVPPVTAPLTVVPEPPLKLPPETSSQVVMPAKVTANTSAAATSGRRQVRTRAR
ncbi:hypothetical protein ABZ770_21485 [Streptomyces sp. NPDC006654]|uniref:hypothetical protein n=1 Tax=unclassified Streptomyces TaxID=2593676 RepID=UPI0033E3B4AA